MDELIKALKEKLGEDVLTKDVETKLKESFEEAVSKQVDDEISETLKAKETELEEKAESELVEFKEKLVEKLDEYVHLSVEEFVEENQAVIESQTKVEIAEKLFEGVTSLFESVGIEIPEEKKDVVADLESKIEKLEEKLDSEISKVLDLSKEKLEYEKALKFKSMTEGYSDSDTEKIADLLEGIEVDGVSDFEKKVKIVIEKFEDRGSKKPDDDSTPLEEDFSGEHITESEVDKYAPDIF
jgi:hypothetical protein